MKQQEIPTLGQVSNIGSLRSISVSRLTGDMAQPLRSFLGNDDELDEDEGGHNDDRVPEDGVVELNEVRFATRAVMRGCIDCASCRQRCPHSQYLSRNM